MRPRSSRPHRHSAPLPRFKEPSSQPESSSALVGTWDYRFSDAEARVIRKDFSGLVDHADSVVARQAFVDRDRWWLGFRFDGELFLLHGVPEGDGGTYTVVGIGLP